MAFLLKRRLRSVGERITAAREELARLDEEVVDLDMTRDDAEVRAVVSESPGAAAEFGDADKHHRVIARERERLRDELSRLERRRDELLDELAERS
ncbi:MAG: hypothetical protein U0U69_11840 [Acidimicrobiia bacterium]